MNIPKRKSSAAIIYRQVQDEPLVVTLEGKTEVKMQVCNTCFEKKPLNAFYCESVSKRKHKNQVRNQCIPCYDKYKGRIPKNILTPPTNDLMNYFDNGESDERRVSLGRKVSTKNS